MTHMIVLNGGSSSGKSSIARCLQEILPRPWLTFSIDDLVDAMPRSMRTADTGIGFGDDGSVSIGEAFRTLEIAWMTGIAAMVRGGAPVIIDDVFLSGAGSQRRWRDAVDGLEVLWVGVRCDGAVAAAREQGRGDRVTGMAESQAELVHRGVDYDLEVDSTHTTALACAKTIAARLG